MAADPWYFVGIFVTLLVAVFLLKSILRLVALVIIVALGFYLLTGQSFDIGW